MRGKYEDAEEDVNDEFNNFEKHGQRYSKPQGQRPANWRAYPKNLKKNIKNDKMIVIIIEINHSIKWN